MKGIATRLKRATADVYSIVPFVALALVLVSSPAAAAYDIVDYELQSTKRVSRTDYEYELKVTIYNHGAPVPTLRADVASTNAHHVVTESALEFGSIESGGDAQSLDTFTVRVNRRFPFDYDDLDFTFMGTPLGEPGLQEAEDVANGMGIGTDVPGFTGSGFVRLPPDAAVTFPVYVPEGMKGAHQIELRYAMPDGVDEALVDIYVDNIRVQSDLSLKRTAFGTWGTAAAYAKMLPGHHDIRIEAQPLAQSIIATLLDSLLFTMTPPDQDRFLTFPRRENVGFFRGSNANTDAYYATIDPDNLRTTFDDFLEQNGFTNGGVSVFNENDANSAHATYQNVADLNFGRDMYVKLLPNGNVASYVQNYASAEDALTQTNLLATVAMEYRAPDNDPNSPKFTTFYVYDGAGNRINKIDLDGRGEKYVPTLCNACHGGKPKRHDGLVYQDEGDTNAKWILWDLDNFSYAAVKPQAAQETQFRKLNGLALCTNPSSANTILVKGWYGDNNAGCNSVAANTFNGNFVPTGWQGHESLYLNVVAPSCRSCHAQRGSYNARGVVALTRGPKEQSLEFNSFSAFANYQDEIERMIYDTGEMPAAKETFERFWRSTQPVILDNELYGGLAHVNPSSDKYESIAKFDFGDRRKPGRPLAVSAGARLIAPGFPYDNYSNEDVPLGALAFLNGGASHFAETLTWSLQSGPTSPSVFPSNRVVETFTPAASSDIAGNGTSPYILRLGVSNSLASYNSVIQLQQWSNSNRDPIVFYTASTSDDDIYEYLTTSVGSSLTCINCHAKAIPGDADSVYNLRDGGFHDDDDASRREFAFQQVVSRIDCRDPELSLLLNKPAGYHHFGGNLSGFGFGQTRWVDIYRWVLHGAPFGDGRYGCPRPFNIIQLPGGRGFKIGGDQAGLRSGFQESAGVLPGRHRLGPSH